MTGELLTTEQAGEILGPSKYTVRDRNRRMGNKSGRIKTK